MDSGESVNNGFVVSPMSQKIKLEAGKTFEGEIMLTVPAAAENDLNYQVSVYPFSVSSDSYQMDFQTMSDWSRIVDWMTLDNTSGTLKPNGSIKIKFMIKVPENAPAGGQYAMIGVRSVGDTNGPATIRDQFEMASLIYAEVEGETKHEGKILENKITGFVAAGTPAANVKLENNGNVHETAEMKLTVKNVFSSEEIALSEDGKNEFSVIVMPESTRDFTREISDLPALGIFEVTQEISFVGENSSVTTVMILCPIWFMVLVLLTITAIIGTVIFSIKKHHKKATF